MLCIGQGLINVRCKNETVFSFLSYVLQGGPGSLFLAFTIWLVLDFLSSIRSKAISVKRKFSFPSQDSISSNLFLWSSSFRVFPMP